MANEQTRVTVVGTYRSADVALPSLSPLGEFTARLAEVCGQDSNDQLPPVWTLSRPDAGPLALDTSLLQAGVVDGEVLYLYDLAGNPVDAPIVKDIEEIVAEETEELRLRSAHPGPVVIGIGLLFLLAAAVLVGLRYNADTGAAIGLTTGGLVLLGMAWGVRQKESATPPLLVQLMALTAVPAMSAAGALIAQGLTFSGWAGAAIGANTAMLMAIAMLGDVLLVAIELSFAAGGGLVALTMGLGADAVESSAVVAAFAIGMLAVSRRLAATVTAWGQKLPRGRQSFAEATTGLVDRSAWITAVVMGGPVVALCVTLPLLALSGRTLAVLLSGICCLALFARGRSAAFTAELWMLGVATAAGGFGLLAALVMSMGGAAASAVLVGVGLTAVLFGIGMSVLVPPRKRHTGSGPKPPIRRSRSEVVGAGAAMAIAPLTIGVFGAFGHLVMVGRTLF
ncbi:EsaB/YukD family protein [Micromonospora sp. LH3U1]|uniref:EsaB/YukD family protein n=1 Tax=Micromonospora sp. LH3U1 TaxID=3018339 RepID=UPI002349B25C|nr:EsaB/YukD family protein [Micromonospora sp. LH3U1]WCN83229.1 EsaB/YukD family protein [Micromonospora sp. LH3U1]